MYLGLGGFIPMRERRESTRDQTQTTVQGSNSDKSLMSDKKYELDWGLK